MNNNFHYLKYEVRAFKYSLKQFGDIIAGDIILNI